VGDFVIGLLDFKEGKTLDELKEVISSSFHELTQRMSFAERWIKRFLSLG